MAANDGYLMSRPEEEMVENKIEAASPRTQWRSDASAGWRHRGIEMIHEAARDLGQDLYDCYVDQCFYDRGRKGPLRRDLTAPEVSWPQLA